MESLDLFNDPLFYIGTGLFFFLGLLALAIFIKNED